MTGFELTDLDLGGRPKLVSSLSSATLLSTVEQP